MKHGPTQRSVNAQRHEEDETRLQGRFLRVAQAVWILVAVVALLLVGVSIPPFFIQSQSLCTGNACNGVMVSPEQAHALTTHGISLTTFAWYSVVVTLLSTLIWFSVGWLLFWHKSDSWFALLFSLQAVTQGATGSIAALGNFPVLQNLATWLNFLNQVLLITAFALFPTGHFVPKWLRWLVLAWVVYNFVDVLFPGLLLYVSWYPAFSFLLFLCMLVIVVIAQVYRYRTVSTPMQRQQTKWIVFAIATIVLVILVVAVLGLWFQPDSLYSLISGNIIFLVLLLGPVSFYIAIMRYRLYDIDVIINKALVYGLLTALLAAVYIGLIIGLQALLQGITRQNSDVAIVVSTLAIFALFEPLRRRIQRIIDRRFYRRKYDAARTIAAFSATLRGEVDLDELRDHLLAVVQETMQPAHVSLWLRPSEQTTKHSAISAGNPQEQ